jgi:shikimate kinase
MKSHNIVLTGFMGAGKTAIGRVVAEKLGREFVDMDAEIEARAGRSIARIFREEGESAFRHMEAMLCAELSERQGLVVATGGGALLDAKSCGGWARWSRTTGRCSTCPTAAPKSSG